jgi:hypothetical protein
LKLTPEETNLKITKIKGRSIRIKNLKKQTNKQKQKPTNFLKDIQRS